MWQPTNWYLKKLTGCHWEEVDAARKRKRMKIVGGVAPHWLTLTLGEGDGEKLAFGDGEGDIDGEGLSDALELATGEADGETPTKIHLLCAESPW